MNIEINKRYTFYGYMVNSSSSLSDTYPVNMMIKNNEYVIVRVNKSINIEKNKYYKVTGIGTIYKDRYHILAESIECIDDLGLSEFEIENIINNILGNKMIDYIKYQEFIEKNIDEINNEILKNITLEIYNKYKDDFLNYPAASKFHHAYKHGLVYHTYNMLRMGLTYVDVYENINKDLVVSGIILHDMMKVKEIKKDAPEYTNEGKLLGHISMISNEIYNTASKLGYADTEEALLLNHIVIAHHDEAEFGSPRNPQILEALIVHLCDVADARIIPTIEALEKTNVGEYTEQIFVNNKNKYLKHKLSK